MDKPGINLSPIRWLGLIIAVMVITDIAILCDIPFLRQISGFIFLTFVPGFLLLSIMKLNRLGLAEKIVLSVGLSVAFAMLFGLLVNSLLLALGYTRPLSTISLIISFNTAAIVLAIIAYLRNRDIAFSFPHLKLTTGEKAFLIVPALFPLLSIVGMRLMNLTDNNVILMLLLFLIPAYVIFISFSNRKVSERVYPAAIFLISISLLLMYSLRSNHVLGADTNREYFLFLAILDDLHWSQLDLSILDACLSISILPAIYQNFLNIDPEYLFKIIYSLFVSVLPLVVYLLSKKYIGNFYAFLASVFLMSQTVFLWTPTYARQNIAILFFGLAIMVVFHDAMSESSKKALFIVFAAATIVSHYSVTYIAFFVLLLTWIGMQILPRIVPRKKGPETTPVGSQVINKGPPALLSPGESPPRSDAAAYQATAPRPAQPRFKRGITMALVALFLVMLFFWYSQMTESSFYVGVRFVYDSFKDWRWFLFENTGESVVQAAFGRTLASTGVAQRIEFVFSWLTIFLMSIGLFATLWKFIRAVISKPNAGQRKPSSLPDTFEAEYLVLSVACFLLLVATVVLPTVAEGYGSTRVYLQMMVPLSIFFVIGGITAARYLKSRPHWVLLAVLIPYTLCTTGVMTQVFGFPRAITLNSEGPLYTDMYISDAESRGAKWVKGHVEPDSTIYVDGRTRQVLWSQGRIPFSDTDPTLIDRYKEGTVIDSYIYLRNLELGEGGLVAKYPDLFAGRSKLYANGGSEVYQ